MRKAAREENSNKKKRKNLFEIKVNIDKKKVMTLIVCALVVISIIAINNYTALGLVLNKTIDSDDAVQIELQTSNNQIIPFNNEILVYNKGKIVFYDNYGRQTGTITLDDTIEANIQTKGKYIQVINKDKNVVYLYKNQYENARIKIDGEICSGIVNTDGTSVIEYKYNGNKIALAVYDKSGVMKYNVKSASKIIGNYTISNNSKYLAYVDVNIDGISAYTKINLIDLKNIKEDAENYKTICDFESSLVFDMYWNGNKLIARSDEEFAIYNVSSQKLDRMDISEDTVVEIGNYENRFAYTKIDEQGKYELCIKKMLSDSFKEVALEDVPKYYIYENGVSYVCYHKKIVMYNNLGIKIKEYDSDMVVTRPIVFNEGTSAAMIVSNKLIMFNI